MLAQAVAFLTRYLFVPRQEYLTFFLTFLLGVSMIFRQISEYSLKFGHGRVIIITY